MAESCDLLWPQCLGVFDEEASRYFLLEIGTRLVPSYPFLFGMGEVYGQILEKYGLDGTPDVTSLLEELLEDDANAAGHGDDGDVWRSWRHGWRHRNDDISRPFVPRFGHLMLRPSTHPRIRKLKAQNFLHQYQQIVAQSANVDDAVGLNKSDDSGKASCSGGDSQFSRDCPQDGTVGHSDTETSKAVVESRQARKQIQPPRLRSCSSIDQRGPRMHDLGSCATDTNPTLSVLFEMLESDANAATQLCLGESTCHTTDDGSLVPQFRAICGHGSCARSPDVTNQLGVRERKLGRLNERHVSYDRNGAVVALDVIDKTDAADEQMSDLFRSDSAKTNASRSVALATASHSSGQQQTVLISEHKKRASNRQARLVDGTIFVSQECRSKNDSQNQHKDAKIFSSENEKVPCSSSWTTIKKRDSLRKKWMSEVNHLLHLARGEKGSSRDTKRKSVPSSRLSSTLCRMSNMSMTDGQLFPQSTQRPYLTGRKHFWLDGAGDQPTDELSAAINLNKPLPLSPDEIVRTMSTRSQISSRQSAHSTNLLSATSTTSSVSRSSSRKEVRGAPHDLLQSEMLKPHELPPIREIDSRNKDLVDPEKSSAPPASPLSFTSVAQGNPFIEQQTLCPPKRPPPLDFSKLHPRSEVPTSQSSVHDNHAIPATVTSNPKQSESYFSSLPWSKAAPVEQHFDDTEAARGRSRPEPTLSASQKENFAPKTPSRRSRSPIRRLLGMTKSQSDSKLEEPNSTLQPTTPGSTKKESLKKWGDRLRYGFLTPDQGQLRQEDLIEAHNNDSATSTPQYSTFPISLEPPVQAKIQSEIELIVTVTANRYLMREARAGRLSAESVAKTKEIWEKMNRPQVVEFHYDQLTQHNLVMSNLDRVRLYGDAAQDPIAINSTLRGWKIMAREMSIRTFCSPDSVIRKHLHDAHRVLELLGAPLVTFLAYEDMQLKALAKISQRQKERMDRRTGSAGRNVSTGSNLTTLGGHRRNASEGSYVPKQLLDADYPIATLQMDKISLSPSPAPHPVGHKVRKATGAEGAIMSLPTNFEKSRDVYAARLRDAKMGLTMKEI